MFGAVLVPVDGSESSMHALDVAAILARASDATLRVLALANDAHPLAAVQSQVAEIAELHGIDPELVAGARTGSAVGTALSDAASSPDALVCIGTSGRSQSTAQASGVLAELLSGGRCPLLVCGPRYEPGHFHFAMSGPVIVALDGSSRAEQVLPTAESWSVVFGLPLEIVTVLAGERPGPRGGVNPPVAGAVTTTAAGGDVLYDTKPAKAIVDEAIQRNATVIAIAARASSDRVRFSQASVTGEVIERSPIPVLVVRPTD